MTLRPKIVSLKQACIEVCCVAEMLRRLGFSADDIYFGRFAAGDPDTLAAGDNAPRAGDLFVLLWQAGGSSVGDAIARSPLQARIAIFNPIKWRTDWAALLKTTMDEWNAGRIPEARFDESRARELAVPILALLAKAGFKIRPEVLPEPPAAA